MPTCYFHSYFFNGFFIVVSLSVTTIVHAQETEAITNIAQNTGKIEDLLASASGQGLKPINGLPALTINTNAMALKITV